MTVASLALKRKRYDWSTMAPFIALHASVVLVFFVPFTLEMIAWVAGSYFLRMFCVTAGYHRYFSHRSFKLNRFWQFVVAFLAQTLEPEGRVVVGGASSRSPSELRSPKRSALAGARGVLVVAPRLDSVRRVRRLRPEAHLRLQQISRAPLAEQVARRADDRLCRGDLPDRRVRRLRVGLPRRDGDPLPRHVPDQLAVAHLGHAPLRDARRKPQQLPAGPRHAGRRLAQQSPSLHVERPPGHSVVGEST